MAQVSRSVALSVDPADVWALIGDFQGLAAWHPGVAASRREDRDGVEHRVLSLPGGGELVEALLGAGPRSYGYAIVSGPLPVEDYVATITVAEAPSGCVVVWSATFRPTSPDAEKIIGGGVFGPGLKALLARFG